MNSWQESETALALADTLDEDAVIVEGYAEYATWRPHLAYLRDPYGDPDMEMEIDGVGGVSILARAKVFRYGVHFPAFSFEKHAETEGFGKVRLSTQVLALLDKGLTKMIRWRERWSFLLSACRITPSGICMSQAWMTSSTWRLVNSTQVFRLVPANKTRQEMEKEKQAREQDEQQKAEKAKKMKDTFGDKTSQWEKDRTEVQNMAFKEEEKKGANSQDGEEKKSIDKSTAEKPAENRNVNDAGQPASESDPKDSSRDIPGEEAKAEM